ncbi:MAG: tripartite tricarboxylate transporter substrate binding protein [Burkholderiales bacterium]|nr:tripartite tricarboxylate transporter substrate binding protein [Burkholderiales bacterium]
MRSIVFLLAPSLRTRARRSGAFAACALLALVSPLCAQTYPAKPIRFIVPYAPGGPTDIIARLLGQRMSESWGQAVLVENRAGANGNIAAELVARSAGDGYTLMLGNTSVFTINPHVYKKLNYDPIKDFLPLSLVVAAPLVLVVHPSLPTRDVKAVIDLALAKPNQLAFSSSGFGGISHMAAELMKVSTRTAMTHVPYKGAGPAATAVVGGEVALSFTSTVSTMHHVNAGRLRALGVTSATRNAQLAAIPAIAEFVPGYEVNPWYGVLMPAGVPEAIVAKVHAEVVRIARLPEVGPRLVSDGGDVVVNTPAQFAAVIKADYERWARVARTTEGVLQ